MQKLPVLLDEIQLLIERDKGLRAILTGSSARKLRRGAANLLGGRAWVCRLHPLVSAELPAYRRTVKRKPAATAKFYFFDVGVANTLKRTGPVQEGSDAYGRALEHQIFLELRSFLDYRRLDLSLAYWRSLSQFEVDFVVADRVAIEVKAKPRVSSRDYKGLLALAEEVPLRRKIVVCGERRRRKTDDGVEVLSVEDFLRDLWSDRILE